MAWLETDAMNERLQFVQDARSDYPLTSVDLCARYLLTRHDERGHDALE